MSTLSASLEVNRFLYTDDLASFHLRDEYFLVIHYLSVLLEFYITLAHEL